MHDDLYIIIRMYVYTQAVTLHECNNLEAIGCTPGAGRLVLGRDAAGQSKEAKK